MERKDTMEKREDENQIAPKFIKRKTQPHNKIRDKTTISNLNYSAIHIRSKTNRRNINDILQCFFLSIISHLFNTSPRQLMLKAKLRSFEEILNY